MTMTLLHISIWILSSYTLGCLSLLPRDKKDTFDHILRPPPLPPSLGGRSELWGSSNRHQRQNHDYKFVPPPPPSKYLQPSPFTPPRFNSPPNFIPITNYGPPPNQRPPEFQQPPTPPPGLFQKLSTWLFPPPESYPHSQQQALPPSHAPPPFSFPTQQSFIQPIPPKKKDCNPCNLVPWIPVIRYQTPQLQNAIYPQTKIPPISFQNIQFGSINQGYGFPSIAPPAIDSYYAPTTAQGQSFVPYNINGKSNFNLGESVESSPKDTFQPSRQEDPINHIGYPPYPPSGFDSSQNISPVAASAHDVPLQKEFVSSTRSPIAEQPRLMPIFHPIPVPNLSSIPIPPLFNARPFKDASDFTAPSSPEKPLVGSNIATHGDISPSTFIRVLTTTTPRNDVQVIQSVPLAEYTSSVEYPINIIQSPLWEIDTTNKPDTITSLNRTDVDNYSAESGGSFQNPDDYEESEEEKVTNGHQLVQQNLRFVTPISGEVSTPFPNNHKPAFSGYDGYYQDLESTLLYLKPSAPHKDFKLFYDQSHNSVAQAPDFTSPDESETTTVDSSTVTDDYRWFESEKLAQSDKETSGPKVIQIIIPYTNEHPSPFKNTKQQFEDSRNDWAPMVPSNIVENQGRKVPSFLDVYGHHDDDYNNKNQETPEDSTEVPTSDYDTTTDTSTSVESTVNYNGDELSFDIVRLQQNIDDWTEQEFSKYGNKWQPQKISTMKNFAVSKKIPDDFFKPSASQRTEKKLSSWTPNHLNSSFYDHEVADSIHYPIGADLHNITVVANINNSLYESNLIVPSKEKNQADQPNILHSVISSYKPQTTTMSYWEKIQTSISPITKEKVYVVTPLPWPDFIEKETKNETKTQNSHQYSLPGPKMNISNVSYYPRFSIRPTPAVKGQKDLNSSSKGFSIEPPSDIKFSWPQSINDLEESSSSETESSRRGNGQLENPIDSMSEGASKFISINGSKVLLDTSTTTTANTSVE